MKKILPFPTEYNGQEIGPDVITKKHNPLSIPTKASNDEKAIMLATHLDSHDDEISRVIRRMLKQITTSPNPQQTAQLALNVFKESRMEALQAAKEVARFEKEALRARAKSVVVNFPNKKSKRVH